MTDPQVSDEQIEAHTRSHDEAQAARTDVCTDCGKPVDQAVFGVTRKGQYQLETRKFDRHPRRLGRFVLTPRREGLPYAHTVSFDGTHDLHACNAFPDQEPIRPTEPWVTDDDLVEQVLERIHWSNTPDASEMGYR